MGSLDDALAKATSGDEIWIAAGTYKPTQLIKTSKKNSRHFPLKMAFLFMEALLVQRRIKKNV